MSDRQKLSPAQAELYLAMERGVVVHFIAGINAHYFRSDYKKLNSSTAFALLDKGWVVKAKEEWRGHILQIKPASQPKQEGPIK